MKETLAEKENHSRSSVREPGVELLRILAMAMVITLHYLGKGGFLTGAEEGWNGPDYLAWFLEAFCVVAVDVYVLISGYFLVDASFRPKKLLKLWAQIFFYSVGVPAVLLCTGILPVGEVYLERLITWCLPVLREHYWFATAYVVLYLFAPFLGQAVRRLSKKQFGQLLALLLFLFSVSKSVLPVDLPMDTGGYDALWFLCLFLVAAYLRLYGIPFFGGRGRSALIYLVCSVLSFGLLCAYRLVYAHTGKLSGFLTSPYQYNHILCLTSAAALFLVFRELKIPQGKRTAGITKVASCTFGIYLLHENEALRYLWPGWLFAEKLRGTCGLVFGILAAVVFWYVIGILVEFIRQWIFGQIFRAGKRKQP